MITALINWFSNLLLQKKNQKLVPNQDVPLNGPACDSEQFRKRNLVELFLTFQRSSASRLQMWNGNLKGPSYCSVPRILYDLNRKTRHQLSRFYKWLSVCKNPRIIEFKKKQASKSPKLMKKNISSKLRHLTFKFYLTLTYRPFLSSPRFKFSWSSGKLPLKNSAALWIIYSHKSDLHWTSAWFKVFCGINAANSQHLCWPTAWAGRRQCRSNRL